MFFSASLYFGALSLLGEYKRYDKFAYEAGLLNNPPTAIREHLFTLLNRHQLVQNADDEEGYLLGFGYPLIEGGILSLNYSRTENLANKLVYEDIYGQFEWDEFLGVRPADGRVEPRDPARCGGRRRPRGPAVPGRWGACTAGLGGQAERAGGGP